VVTLSNPVLKGEELSHDVKILEGNMPDKGGPIALFIDIIGMPLTPMSYASVARRTTYRRTRTGIFARVTRCAWPNGPVSGLLHHHVYEVVTLNRRAVVDAGAVVILDPVLRTRHAAGGQRGHDGSDR
jgi:hypothetical protein